ncbi:MAG: iduronate-2-sulfatase, partial [Planctomycetaceae bacterium]|nr:iduronate-2-sulfatase [Planctomycetaceae bacterium]
SYFDREPSKMPQAMGYSVRTPLVRYTEWRDWKTGDVIAKELYDATADPAEMNNVAGAVRLANVQREVEAFLRKQFSQTGR